MMRTVIITVLLILLSLPLFASQRMFELDIKVSPYTLQHVNYEGNVTPKKRTSNFGAGLGTAIYYNHNKFVGFGAGVSYEFHKFNNFFNYNDFKIDCRIKLLLAHSKNDFFKLYFNEGAGVDFVLRSDKGKGHYPLFLIGFNADFNINDKWSLNAGCDGSLTVQPLSSVLHITTIVGATYRFGGAV